MSGHWNNDLTEVAPILSPIYKRANSDSIAQRPCSVPETLWETPDSKPQKSGALPMSHHISTKRHRQQWATLHQTTKPTMRHHIFLPMSQHISANGSTHRQLWSTILFSPWATKSSITEPPHLRLLSHHTVSPTKNEPPHLKPNKSLHIFNTMPPHLLYSFGVDIC